MLQKVIVVDDNPADSILLEIGLKQKDPCLSVQVFDDGQLLIEHFRNVNADLWPPCDLLLLDLNMPKLSGFDVLKNLKREQQFRQIPVVVLSGTSAPDEVELCYSLGANSFMIKPTGIDAVFEMANQLVNYWSYCQTVKPHVSSPNPEST